MPPKPVKYDDAILIQLARDIVMDIHPLEVILSNLNLSARDWEAIQKNATFQRYVKQMSEKWHAIENVKERIEFKSLYMLEMGIDKTWNQFTNKDEPLKDRNIIFQNWMKCAGIGGNKEAGGPTENVKIQIVIGGQKISLEQEITPKVIDVTPKKEEE